MPKQSIIELVIKSFQDESIELSEKEIDYKNRILHVMEIRIKNLASTDYDLYRIIKRKYENLSFSQVIKDIAVVERMIAYDQDPTGDPRKVWYRYFITEVTKKAIAVAQAKGDAYTMAYASNILGKHQQTDKEDAVKLPYDEIIPFIPEITTDPSVIGIKPIDNIEELKEKMLKKYGISDIQEAQIIDTDEEKKDLSK